MMSFPLAAKMIATAIAVALLAGLPMPTFAQSGTRSGTSQPQRPPASQPTVRQAVGSSSRTGELPIGLRGYCPVCLVEMKQWIKGDPRVAVEYDGKKYLFPGAEQAEMFRQSPGKYVPVLNGDDIVHYVQTGERVEGTLAHGVVHEGRTFFFATVENQRLFQSNPDQYANADLALGGECIVCRVNMKQRVAGTPEFAAVYNGLRYYFPGEEQRAMFLASPDQFVEVLSPPAERGQQPARPPASGPAGSGVRGPTTSGSGTR